MTLRSTRMSAVLPGLLFLLFAGGLVAQTQPASEPGRPSQTDPAQTDRDRDGVEADSSPVRRNAELREEHPAHRRGFGFAEDSLIVSIHPGSIFNQYGGLVSHEGNYYRALRFQDMAGTAPLQFLGVDASPDFFQEPRYEGGFSGFAELEYGLTDHIGVGLGYRHSSLDVMRHPEVLQLDQSYDLATPRFSTHAFVKRVTLFKENALMGTLTYHPLPTDYRVDPYLIARAGFGHIVVSHRNYNSKLDNLLRSESDGASLIAGGGLGVNVMLFRALGVKLEVFVDDHSFSTEAVRQSSISTQSVTLGWILDTSRL